MKAALGIFLAIMAGGGANAGPDGKEVPRVAFLGFEFINTSLEATARVEVERIRLLDDVLRQKLTASSRFEIVDIPPDTIKEIASGPTISNCNGCQRRFAQMVGANWAAWGTVQKVSNLILNINVYMEDAESGKMKFARSVDIRGNTDELENRRKVLSEGLSVLNPRERCIFEARRLADDPITLENLASEFGASRERVRQIEVRAFEKVQKAVKNRVAPFETSAPLQVQI